ncbi:MAG: PilT/PilU family type 4a pilus ATPase [Lentisphaeria bacterium]|nr:PilT/PilU family type 4a pilus ATPase [Lentisphaeria bacterium]
MNLEIQWFIYALVSNEIVTVDFCTELYQSMNEPDLGTYAQTMLNNLAQNMDEDSVQSFMEQIQTVLDFAVQQAQSGTAPDIFAPVQPEISFADLPPLDNISQMSDQEVADTMVLLLSQLRLLGASDMHISAMSYPFMRKALTIQRFSDHLITPEEAERMNRILLTPEQEAKFNENQDLSYALEIGPDRFRVAVMQHKDGIAGSYRIVPDHICSLEELGYLPTAVKTIERMLDYTNGLVLVTGPIGSGKTTTLGAMVDILNSRREDHIITVEDPIEILQVSRSCQVTQRQVGQHTNSYRTALKAALREDPDIIVIGEMHDLETIENAITASETGHLVIGTLHTNDAGSTLNRILDVFPPAQQAQIRTMVAGSLRGIICQKLIPDANGGLTLAYEIMTNVSSISNLIADGKTHQLRASMQIGSKSGMCTMDQCLLEKYKLGLLEYETALSYMTDSSIITQIKQLYAMQEARKLQDAMPDKKKK